MVDDGGDAAVGVDGRVPGLFLDILGDINALPDVLQPVGFLELLEDDGGFVAVGGAYNWLDELGLDTCKMTCERTPGEELDASVGYEACGLIHCVGRGGEAGGALKLRTSCDTESDWLGSRS